MTRQRSGRSNESRRIASRPVRIEYWTPRLNRTIVLGALAPANSDPARTILVADDEPTIRKLLREVLELHGHSVIEAGSGAEIFRLLESGRPDVLLVDVHLGADDGLAIGVGLRGERRYSSLKIVFMSGTPDAGEVLRLSQTWNVPILVKPFDFDALLAAID